MERSRGEKIDRGWRVRGGTERKGREWWWRFWKEDSGKAIRFL